MTSAEAIKRWVGDSDVRRLASYLFDVGLCVESESRRTQNWARENGEMVRALHDKLRHVLSDNKEAGEGITYIALSDPEMNTVDFCRHAPRYNMLDT